MFTSNRYLVRKKIFSLLGAVFEVYDDKGELVLYAKQKAFRLREEIKFYSEREMVNEIFTIKARNIIDFSATYDIREGDKVIGSLRRKGLKSILRDEWLVLDSSEKDRGVIIEDSVNLALVRRFLLNIIPQNYDYMLDGNKVADFKQQFNPFIYKMDVEILDENADKRVVLASSVILSLIDGRQE